MKRNFLFSNRVLSISCALLFVAIFCVNILMVVSKSVDSGSAFRLSSIIAQAHDGDEFGDEPALDYARSFVISEAQTAVNPDDHCTYTRTSLLGRTCEGIGHKACIPIAISFVGRPWVKLVCPGE